MFSYYGSKNKIAKLYPLPQYDLIIEPFAGASWYSVLHRNKNVLLNEKYEEKRPTYKGCSVDKRWHNFQNFAEWFEDNFNTEYMENWHLDKDILVKGNKIYSPETCCFVPQEINTLFTKRQNCRGKLPIGVKFNKRLNKFEVSLSIKGRATYRGVYLTIEEAFQRYKSSKKEEIMLLANKYQKHLVENCYNALINYKVEIND